MDLLLCTLLGYLFGNVNAAYIISKLKGFDIRDKGSGNAGASNAIIVMGKKAGIITMFVDIGKAILACEVAARLFPALKAAKIVSGSACIIGHIFPFLMKFHGGKGLASLGGMILSYDPRLFIMLLTVECVLGFGLDYICVVPITGSLLFTLIYALTTGDPFGTMILASVAMVILYKHMQNLHRIMNGTEAHISYLWNKEKEIDRVTDNKN